MLIPFVSFLLRFCSIDKLFAVNREKFLQAYARDSVRHYKTADLEKAFVTHGGIQYYRFPKSMSMPINRIGKVQNYIAWMARGLSAEEHDRILDVMEKVLMDGLAVKKGAAKIGAMIQEMRDRKNMTVHSELIYNFVAIQYIRQDENPEIISQDIHSLKIKELKAEAETYGNTGFFFHMPELKGVLKHLDISEDQWKLFWNVSIKRQEALKAWSKSLHSESA